MRAWWSPIDGSNSRVYFVQNPANSAVKIGRTRNLEKRLATLRTAIPDLLYIGSFPGDARAEADLHASFADDRIAGEWFRPTMGLAQLIAALVRPERAS